MTTNGLGAAIPFTSVEDATLIIRPELLRENSGYPKDVVVGALNQILSPSQNPLHGNSTLAVTNSLSKQAREYFRAITTLMRGGPVARVVEGGNRAVPPVRRELESTWQAPKYGEGLIPTPSSTPFPPSSFSDLMRGNQSTSTWPLGQPPSSGTYWHDTMPGLSSLNAQQDPYRRMQPSPPFDPNPFGFLRETRLPLDTIQQISMTDQPVPLAAFMRHESDMRAPMLADYNRAYTQYRHQLPPEDLRTFASTDASRDYRPDMQMANTYQVIQIANMREKYKAAIRGNDKTLGRVTSPMVDDLSITQLIEYHSRQQLEVASTMNSWFYSMGIVLAGGMCSNIFNGSTGVRVLDRFVNLSSLSTRLREMKQEPWWDYSLRQISKNGVENHPGLGFAMIIAMALTNTVQDGVLKYNQEKERKEKEARQTRLLRLESARAAVDRQQGSYPLIEPIEDDQEDEEDSVEQEIPTRPMVAKRATEDTAKRARSRRADGTAPVEEKVRSSTTPAVNSDRIKELLSKNPV